MESDAFNQHHVFVDTDIGDDIDDALDLTVIINSPEIALQVMSTVFGDTAQRARLAAYLLHIFGGADIPVAARHSMPLQFRHQPSSVPQIAVSEITLVHHQETIA